jgi:hypothetical protein
MNFSAVAVGLVSVFCLALMGCSTTSSRTDATHDLSFVSAVDKDGFARDKHGNLFKTNQETALKACAKNGMHLATIRELTTMSVARSSLVPPRTPHSLRTL